jgi:hypothetical protein
MLRILRGRSGAPAAALLCVLLAGVSTPHAAGPHDDHGAGTLAPHDASSHRVGGERPADRDQTLHCVICHWTRSFRPDSSPAHGLDAPDDPALHVHPLVRHAPLVFPAAQPPLRSPPGR